MEIMKRMSVFLLLIIVSCTTKYAQAQDIDTEKLKKLDAQWEKALLESDADFISSILAEDFVWVHNHASMIDTKEALVKRSKKANGATGNPRSRISKDVKVIMEGATGVVTGLTIVDRGPSPTTYHFMRTYAQTDGKWLLLANHTMAIPKEEGK